MRAGVVVVVGILGSAALVGACAITEDSVRLSYRPRTTAQRLA